MFPYSAISRTLPGPVGVHSSTHDGLINIYITVPDFQVKPALRVGADPCFVLDARTLTAKIGKGNQVTDLTFLTFRKYYLVQRGHLPTMANFT